MFNVYSGLTVLAEQDPLKSFDPRSVTVEQQGPTNLIVFWLVLTLAIFLMVVLVVMNSQGTSKNITIPFTILGALGLLVVSVNMFSANYTAYLKANIGEFSQWADARYDVEIRDDQYSTLNTIKGQHSGTGFSNPVLTEEGFVKAWIENEKVTLMFDDEKAKELPLSERLAENK